MIFHSLTCPRFQGCVENQGQSPRISTFPGGPCEMLMNDKIIFDRYYCINSTKQLQKKTEKILADFIL